MIALIFVAGVPSSNASEADTTAALPLDYKQIRGIEREAKSASAGLRKTVNTILYLPRTLTAALISSAGYGANLAGRPMVVETAQSIFTFNSKTIGWYPQIGFATGAAGGLGASVFYRDEPLGGSVAGGYGSHDVWAVKGKVRASFVTGTTAWQLKLALQARDRNDFKFYGFGADPLTDSRNSFSATAVVPYGVFVQYMSQLEMVAGARPSRSWQFFYTFLVRERKVNAPDQAAADGIDNTFEPNTIPGLAADAQTRTVAVYNELAARLDSREFANRISPGVRIEAYAGYSKGVDGNGSRVARGGIDAAIYVPVIRRNRVIMVRAIYDVVDNRNDAVPVSFVEFARQRSFRGSAPSELLRTDRVSLAPTLEYQWPLTFNLSGHIFVDYLLVAPKTDALTFKSAPHAVGVAIDLQNDLARLAVSNGSEGWRFQFTFGVGGAIHNRTQWY